uniref:CCHC-type domain-containing protein n=1 Tax=Panagrellus redivivus TaxID=6233 RepID=A0A7E4WAY7_PANRE
MENVGDIPDEDVQRSHGGLPFRPVVAQGNEDNGDDTGGDVGFGLLGLFGVGNDDHNDENVSQGNGSRDNLLNLPRMEDEIVETIGEQLSNGKLEPGKIGHQVELWLASLYENLDDLSDGIQTANDMLFRMRKQGSAVNPEALGQAMGCVRRLMEVPEAIEVFAAKQVKLSELDTFLKKYQCESLDEMITLVNRAVDRNKDRVKQLETEKETLKAALKDAETECARTKAEIAKSDAKVVEMLDQKLNLLRFTPTEPSRAATVPEWKPVPDGPGPGKVGRTPLARSLTAPKPFDGKNRAELNQYYALFDIYVDANRLQEREKIVLLEANLPVSLRMHWQFLKKQDLTFEQMKLRLAALLGGSSKHSQMTAEYNLQTMQKKYQENFFDFCTRAEKMATEAFPEDYEKMQAALKTLLVGTLQRDRYYEVGTLITAVETMDYTGLKEQVLVLEKAKSISKHKTFASSLLV